MLKKLMLCIALLWTVTLGHSQDKLFPIRVNYEWGFVNSDGKEVIAPKYDAVGHFGTNSYTNILLNGSVGLVHKNGQELFIPKVNTVRVLNDSTVAVRKDTLWGMYDMQGQERVSIKYGRILSTPAGHVQVQKGDSIGIKDRNNNYLLFCRFSSISYHIKGYYKATSPDSCHYFSFDGELLLEGIRNQFDESNWPVVIDQDNDSSGTVLHVLNQIRSPKFMSCKLAAGKEYTLNSIEGKSLLYNAETGNSISVPENSRVLPYTSGYYKYFKDGKQGILNAQGRILLPAAFDAITLNNNLFLVNNNRLYGLYHTNGRRVLPAQYSNIYRDPSGLWMLQNGELLGCAKPNGTRIMSPVFRRIQIIDRQLRGDYGEGQVAFVEFDEAWNITDRFIYKNVKTVFLDFGRVNGPVTPPLSSINSSIRQNNQNSPPEGWFQSQFNRKWGFRRPDSSLRHKAKFDIVKHFDSSALTRTYERIPADASVEVLDGKYYQNARRGVAHTENGNYLVVPKYWQVFESELRMTDAGYVRVLRYDGKMQAIMRETGQPVKKLYTFLDSLEEGMARYNVNGNIVASENKNYRTNLFQQGEFHRLCGIRPITESMQERRKIDRSYIRFDYGKWGFLNKDGANAIDATFDFVYPFYKGTAIVKYNGRWGVIDKKGDFVIKPLYYNVKRVEYEGKVFFHVFKKQARFGLIDTAGNTVLYPEFLKAANFKGGMLAVKYKRGWTFIDSTLQTVCDAKYEEVRDFSNGRAAVKKNGKWGFINRLGDVVVLPTYSQVMPYRNQCAWVSKRGKWYLINHRGKTIGDQSYRSPYPFSYGVAFAQKQGNNTDFGLVNASGEFIVKPRFSAVSTFNEYGVAVVSRKNRSALILPDGSFRTEFDFLKIDTFHCGWAIANTVSGKVLLHHSGRTRPIKENYQSIEPFINGVARVTFGDLYGYLDTNGREIIPCTLTKARPFSEGKAFIQQRGLGTQCINTRGEVLFSMRGWVQYDYQENMAIVRKEGRSYFMDTLGTLLFDQSFKAARPFSQGSGRVKVGKKWAVINVHGQMLNSPKFVKIKTFNTQNTVVKRSGSYGLFDSEGSVVLDVMYDEMDLDENRYFFLSIQDKVGHYDLAGEGAWVWEPSR